MHPSVTCPTLSRASAIILIALSLPAVLSAQSAPRTPSTAPAHFRFGPDPPVSNQPLPLVAPVFLQTDQIDSSITVVNSIIYAVNGTVTLRDQQGHVIGQQTLSFPAHSSTPVAMKTLLAAGGSGTHSGSVTLEQDPAMKGPALLAQLSMTLHAGSQPSFLEEELGMPTAHGSAVLQGVASQTKNLPLIAITSVSDAAQTIHASCAGENTSSSAIELPAFGTAVVQACSWQSLGDNSLNLSSSLLSSGGAIPADHAITLKTDSVPGAFYAFGFALNAGLDQPQLQPLDFYDPGLLPSTSTVYVGVPVGANSVLNSVLSAPVLTLANFSGQSRQTTVTWSDSSSGSPKVQPIATLTLPPFSTKTTTLSSATGSGLLNTFTISSDGSPGDVQAHLFTRVGTSEQRTELLAKDARDDHNGGDHPWSIANGDVSTLLLYNPTSQTQTFQVRLSGSGSSWLQVYHLVGYETRSLSLNDIVGKGTADHKGHKLPTSLTTGDVQWFTDFGGTGLGRLLVSNNSKSQARNFSCNNYTNMCLAEFTPDEFDSVALGNTVTLAETLPQYCGEPCPTCCANNGAMTGGGGSYTTTWSGGNSSYTNQVGSNYYSISLKGIAVGSFYVNAVVEAGSCQSSPMNGGGNVTPSISYSNLKDLALAAAGAQGGITSNQVTATGQPSGGTYSWSSNNSNVSLSNTTSATVTMTAAAAGTSTVTVTYTQNSQSVSASMTVNVFQPSSVSILSDTGSTASHVCYAGTSNQYYGPARSVQYQIQATNQSGNTVPVSAAVTMAESFTPVAGPPPSCGSAPSPTSFPTQQTFTDNFNYCSSSCLPVANNTPKGSCTLALQHVWTANGFPVFNHTLTYTCTSVTPQ